MKNTGNKYFTAELYPEQSEPEAKHVSDNVDQRSGKGRRSRVEVERLNLDRVEYAKQSFSTRRVPKSVLRTLLKGAVRPRAGDLVLARIDRLRQHKKIELPTGRRAALAPGDEIIVACGNRYATDQYEAVVPSKLGRAHLVAAGGIAAIEMCRARQMSPASEITLLGLLGDENGIPLNLMAFALPKPKVTTTRPPVIAVLGTSMNSGKTTTARYLVSGLKSSGLRVGYTKVTGTGAGNDYWSMVDAGAWRVVDFTDAGFASTYLTPAPVIETILVDLVGYLVQEGCQAVVVEIADGLLQQETSRLIPSDTFKSIVDRALFASGDPLAAMQGVTLLEDIGVDVAGVSGLLTASPLPLREAIGTLSVPVWTGDELSNPLVATSIVAGHPRQPFAAASPSDGGESHGLLEQPVLASADAKTVVAFS